MRFWCSLISDLSGNWPEDTSASGLLVVIDNHRGVFIELDVGAIGSLNARNASDDDGLHDVFFLDDAARSRALDRSDDNIPDVGSFSHRTAKHLEALNDLSAGVVSYFQICLHLDHF